MSTRSEQAAGCGFIGFFLSLVMVWILSAIFRPRNPDAEAAKRASSGIRILALVIGVSAPLVVVYLIYRLREQSEPGLDEIVDVLQQEGLMDGRENAQKYLFPGYKLLERGKRDAGDGDGD